MMDLDETIKKIDEESGIKVEEETIIAVSNSYISKFYFDERLNILPKELKDGIKVLMVTFTEENGGILEMRYNDKLTSIFLFSYKDDNDFLYDDIASGIKMQKLEKESEELFNNLAIFCKMKFHEVDKFMEKNKADDFFKMYYGCEDCGCGHGDCDCGHDDCDCEDGCDCGCDGECDCEHDHRHDGCGCGCHQEHK